MSAGQNQVFASPVTGSRTNSSNVSFVKLSLIRICLHSSLVNRFNAPRPSYVCAPHTLKPKLSCVVPASDFVRFSAYVVECSASHVRTPIFKSITHGRSYPRVRFAKRRYPSTSNSSSHLDVDTAGHTGIR